MKNFRVIAVLALAFLATPDLARPQSADLLQKFVHVANNYQVIANITYLTASNWDAKLDIYQPRGLAAPNPALIYFHGRGWTGGSKESSSLTGTALPMSSSCSTVPACGPSPSRGWAA